MDFAKRQRDPKRHLVGLTFVVLIHALVIYGLMTGLARKAVEVVKKPVTATIVEELQKPPPPPPPPPPKKVEPPPKAPPPIQQPYVPPPEVNIAPPRIEAPTITAVTPTVPVAPYVIAPPAPPHVEEAPPAPPAAPKPAIRNLTYARIGGEDMIYPRAAIRSGIEKGRVVARVNIDEEGNVTDVTIVSATPPRVFNQEVTEKLKTWKFKPEGQKYTGEVEINFTLKD